MLADKCHVILKELGLAAKSKTKCHSFYCLILFIPSSSFVDFTNAYYVNRASAVENLHDIRPLLVLMKEQTSIICAKSS